MLFSKLTRQKMIEGNFMHSSLRKLFVILILYSCTIFAESRQDHEFDYLDGVKTQSIQDLPQYADGVQLEGGYVYKKLKPGQKYANVSVVWDLPFKSLEATEAFAHGKEKFRGRYSFPVIVG